MLSGRNSGPGFLKNEAQLGCPDQFQRGQAKHLKGWQRNCTLGGSSTEVYTFGVGFLTTRPSPCGPGRGAGFIPLFISASHVKG